MTIRVSMGETVATVVSIILLAIKYAEGLYNLLAYSRRKTSLSIWKVKMEPKRKSISRPTRTKKLHPA